MNLYKLTQTEHTGYDTYDSMVVAAENEAAARLIHPYNYLSKEEQRWFDYQPEVGFSSVDCWASSPENVVVELIGIAIVGIPEGIISTSFNAG